MKVRFPSILSIYKSALQGVFKNWRAILIVYLVNILIAFIAIGPVSNLLKKAFGNTDFELMNDSAFDFSLFGDFLRIYNQGLSISFYNILSFVCLYFFWSVFYQGGWTGIIYHKEESEGFSNFWKGGIYYFFRFFRLAIYVTISLIGVFYLAFIIFSQGELNPLHVNSEEPYIIRFWVLSILLIIIYFWFSIFRDVAKINIAKYDPKQIAISNLKALKKSIKLDSILLGLINAFAFLIVIALYYLLKKFLSGYVWPVIILSQLFLLYRITYKFVKLNSFCELITTERV